jgi:UDP-N-acetylmuramoyl-L-alanyl-D-glutamate--2,6-diaminopimelate ligase
MSPKEQVKRLLPPGVLSVYHRLLAIGAAIRYGNPSEKLLVIGVTGTKGKSTTSNILWRLLTDAGHTVGLTGTVNIRIGDRNELATAKMTMPGRFALQRYLRQMVQAGCDVAIIETTSEGIKQWRHLGIHYDICVFTNLSPEHLESHGGFTRYKQAKLELFRHLQRTPTKLLHGKEQEKIAVVNADSEHAPNVLAIGDFRKVRVGHAADNDLVMTDVRETISGTAFKVNGQDVVIPLLGEWNADNTLVAMGVAHALGIPLTDQIRSAKEIDPVPGRMEFVQEGQPFTVIVDYAYEPVSLERLYSFCRGLLDPGRKLITLVSSTGGGRDVGRRPKNGAVAGRLCDCVIVTDEDPYDDDPQEIIDQVAAGVAKAGKIEGKNFWRVRDRRVAIRQAFQLAEPGDVVLLTAKGAEQAMVVAGYKKIPWDDRQVAREELRALRES